MIDLYAWPIPNAYKVSIMLEIPLYDMTRETLYGKNQFETR